MSQRIAIVTGGIGGLGSAICRKLAESGRTVIAADLGVREDRIAEFKSEMADLGERVQFEALNVADEQSCNDLVARVNAKHGRVDVLVNAAGITRDTTLRKMTTAQWQDLMRVNLDGVFYMSRAVVEGMCDRGFGRIVNISSVNGQTGQFGQTNYSASKAGLHGFTMALAREVARKGVTVNSVSPGYCRTAMVMSIPDNIREQIVSQIPVGRIGEPADVVGAVVFLASPAANMVTGHVLLVDGGWTAW